MELRHLRYFVADAEEGHITRAAERLGIQQPPLSQQIQALERELDAQLFRRKPRGVELTPAGRTLYDEARAILARADEAVAATKRAAQGEAGRVGIGFTSSPVGKSDDLFVRPLLDEPMVAALPSGHCLSGASDDLPLAALASETFI